VGIQNAQADAVEDQAAQDFHALTKADPQAGAQEDPDQ
jgi:hypothetical protein